MKKGMLMLTLPVGKGVIIGDVEFEIGQSLNSQVSVCIKAPKDIKISRMEEFKWEAICQAAIKDKLIDPTEKQLEFCLIKDNEKRMPLVTGRWAGFYLSKVPIYFLRFWIKESTDEPLIIAMQNELHSRKGFSNDKEPTT